ncbi:Hypothetical protein R9X50_00232100 [Acrodontium crateriforme]|uniref:Uncharacterized protein n=1 Tax=Acrodontium crateriforme TaxID=150365 RepID=A0AAQ3M6R0_9PEZI|nr:Hypothetical protein R9X50_00232100 [Acrodontium crateriforme]
MVGQSESRGGPVERENNTVESHDREENSLVPASSKHVEESSNKSEPSVPFGEDNASDWHTGHITRLTRGQIVPTPIPSSEIKACHQIIDSGEQFLPVQMPVSTPSGLAPFTYERALCNRIKYHRLCEGGDLDVRKFTPIFVHSMLMLPGTMANTLQKGSSFDCFRRMTPALLPGFHPHVHNESRLPCLVQSSNPLDHVQGMLLMGQGKAGKNLVNQHYHRETTRTKQQVECEVLVHTPRSDRIHPDSPWCLCRVKIRAYVWLWSSVDPAAGLAQRTPRWTIEDYIAGNFGPPVIRTIHQDGSDDDPSSSEYTYCEQQIPERIKDSC